MWAYANHSLEWLGSCAQWYLSIVATNGSDHKVALHCDHHRQVPPYM